MQFIKKIAQIYFHVLFHNDALKYLNQIYNVLLLVIANFIFFQIYIDNFK